MPDAGAAWTAKLDLTAPAPRTADGKADLSGTWMHELTSAAEMKRLIGAPIEEAIKVDVPGIEIGTQHKYAINVLLDFKPEDVAMTPAAAAILKQRSADSDPSDVCRAVPGFPLAGLLSEPIKIVQAPRLTIVLYAVDQRILKLDDSCTLNPKSEIADWTGRVTTNLRFRISDLRWAFVQFQVFRSLSVTVTQVCYCPV